MKKFVERLIPLIPLYLLFLPSSYYFIPLFKNKILGFIVVTSICSIIYIIVSKLIESIKK